MKVFLTYFCTRSKIKVPDNIKENKVNLSNYNLQDILEPLAKVSAGTARTQYLSVSRYVAGQPSGKRRNSNLNGIIGSDNSRKNSGIYNNKQTGNECELNKT